MIDKSEPFGNTDGINRWGEQSAKSWCVEGKTWYI